MKTKLLIVVASLFLAGCVDSIPFVPDKEAINKVFGTPPPRLEKRLESIAADGYRQIVAFSHADQKPLTDDDLQFLKTNSPQTESRMRRTDDSTFAVVGTNIPFTNEQLNTLRQRFVFKDFSQTYAKPVKPASSPPVTPRNANAENTNTGNANTQNTNAENTDVNTAKPEQKN